MPHLPCSCYEWGWEVFHVLSKPTAVSFPVASLFGTFKTHPWHYPTLPLRPLAWDHEEWSWVRGGRGMPGSWTLRRTLHPSSLCGLAKYMCPPTNAVSSRKKGLDQIILKSLWISGYCTDGCAWQFAIYSEGNGSELQEKEFNLDTVENFLMSQDIKLWNEWWWSEAEYFCNTENFKNKMTHLASWEKFRSASEMGVWGSVRVISGLSVWWVSCFQSQVPRRSAMFIQLPVLPWSLCITQFHD